MKKQKKICFFTGTRAEYGLLKPLMYLIKGSPEFEFQLIVTGMHLSPEFGSTYKMIENDFFPINEKIEILLSSDSPTSISKAMGLGLISFSDTLQRLKPNLAVLLGDRFESFSFASACMIANVPVAHIHGGEATEGLIDEAIRHSITKMSHLHFTSTEGYRKRVIQLGEHPERVFNVGAIGIDNINSLKLFSRKELEENIKFKLNKKNLLVVYHPVTLEKNTSFGDFKILLSALEQLEDTNLFFSFSNADTDGRIINSMIEVFSLKHPRRAYFSRSFDQLTFLSVLKHVDAIVGNSSSGIIEAPSLNTATINIGDRQKGRIQTDSVINCKANRSELRKALNKLYSEDFQEKLIKIQNPYGTGGTAKKIYQVIHESDLSGLIKKKFHNISFDYEK